jgi:hypothetical protein
MGGGGEGAGGERDEVARAEEDGNRGERLDC